MFNLILNVIGCQSPCCHVLYVAKKVIDQDNVYMLLKVIEQDNVYMYRQKFRLKIHIYRLRFLQVKNILKQVKKFVLSLYFLRVRCALKKLLKFLAISSSRFTSLCKVFDVCISFWFASLAINDTKILILLYFIRFSRSPVSILWTWAR